MRRLIWSAKARRDFDEAVRYVAADRPIAAQKVGQRILAAAASLAEMPTGRRGRVAGSYEKVVTGPPYILAYSLDGESGAVRILHLIHSARDWPDGAWPG